MSNSEGESIEEESRRIEKRSDTRVQSNPSLSIPLSMPAVLCPRGRIDAFFLDRSKCEEKNLKRRNKVSRRYYYLLIREGKFKNNSDVI